MSSNHISTADVLLANPRPPRVMIKGDDGRTLLTINPDGTVEGDICDAGEAARLFCKSLRQLLGPEPNQLELAAKVADRHAQRARDNVAECKNWSPAQAEWSRARDLAVDIAEEIRALDNGGLA